MSFWSRSSPWSYSSLGYRYHDAEERNELFADLGQADEGVRGVQRTKLSAAFPEAGKKMLLLFDYGDRPATPPWRLDRRASYAAAAAQAGGVDRGQQRAHLPIGDGGQQAFDFVLGEDGGQGIGLARQRISAAASRLPSVVP